MIQGDSTTGIQDGGYYYIARNKGYVLICWAGEMVVDRMGTKWCPAHPWQKRTRAITASPIAPTGATHTPFPGGRTFNGQTVKRRANYKRALSFDSRASECWILKARLAVEAASYHRGLQM